jgi:hypothetical protein
MLPPYPLPGGGGRFAAGVFLLGAKPALTLAVPLVSPPTSPTSSTGHAPCWRFGIEEFSMGIAVVATSGKSWEEDKISRDILEEPE